MGDETLRTDLAAPNGASLVGWRQSGSGATARTVQAKLRESIDVMDFVEPADYAAVLAGVVDSSGAISSALDEALQRGGGEVVFPAGTFVLASPVSKSLAGQQSIALRGAGSGLTQLIVPTNNSSGDGLIFSISHGNWWLDVAPSSSIRISNLSIVTRKSFAGTGLKINGGSKAARPPAPVQLHQVEIRGGSTFNESFEVALHLEDSASVWVDSCRFFCGGPNQSPGSNVIGVRIDATPASNPPSDLRDPTSIYFGNCEWTYGYTGVSIGNHVEGVYFSNCAILQTHVGVDWRTTTDESGLHWIGGHLNCNRQNLLIGRLFDWVVQGALLFGAKQNGTACIDITSCSRYTISGCTILAQGGASDTSCISIKSPESGNARGAYIGGNALIGATTGIVVASSASNVRIGDNSYSAVQARYQVSGATNSVDAKSFTSNAVYTLAGGAASETINVAVPSGFFLAKPRVVVASAEASSSGVIAAPQQQAATATTIPVLVSRMSGAAFAPGSLVRVHAAAWE